MFKNSYVLITSIASFFVSFVVSSITISLIIKFQKKKVEGQVINIYLDKHHQNKKLTPTLGGVAIICGIIFSSLFYYQCYKERNFLVVIFLMLSFFFIGLFDDLIKVKKKNYQGLSAKIRFLLELLIAIVCYLVLSSHYDFSYVSLFNDQKIYIGNLILLLFPFIIVGTSNSVNLTDGLDGLSSSLYLLALLPFIIFSLKAKEYYITYILVSSFGATLGFISFNMYPSKIFMGDSGSLSLGGLLGISSLILHKEIYLFLAGGVFVFETISVILQVLSFKLFHKRIFLMAPFHHHLELKGYQEYQIVMYFFIVGLVLTFTSVFIGILF